MATSRHAGGAGAEPGPQGPASEGAQRPCSAWHANFALLLEASTPPRTRLQPATAAIAHPPALVAHRPLRLRRDAGGGKSSTAVEELPFHKSAYFDRSRTIRLS